MDENKNSITPVGPESSRAEPDKGQEFLFGEEKIQTREMEFLDLDKGGTEIGKFLSKTENSYRKSLLNFSDSPDRLNGYGEFLFSKGNFHEAMYYLHLAYQRAPDNEKIKENMVKVFEKVSNSENGIQKYFEFRKKEELKLKSRPQGMFDEYLYGPINEKMLDDENEEWYCEGGKELVIEARMPCNYNCYYCLGNGFQQSLIPFDLERIKNHYHSINEFVCTHIECGTGELTIHPLAKLLLEICAEFKLVFFPSNLSVHPSLWFPGNNKHRLSIVAALHPQNELNLNQFIENIIWIKEKNARVQISYVCHPKRFYKKECYAEIFKNLGFRFKFTPYSGCTREQSSLNHIQTRKRKSLASKERNGLGKCRY